MNKLGTPGLADTLSDTNAERWTNEVLGHFESSIKSNTIDGNAPPFVSPFAAEMANAQPAPVTWRAFPKQQGDDYARVDADRGLQDEYCEWVVRRTGARLEQVTFTTEVPDYFDFLYLHDRERLLTIYRAEISPDVELADLGDGTTYDRENRWNASTGNASGAIMHMVQGANNLAAAVRLGADASWPVVDDNGNEITDEQDLIRCRRFGDPKRHSDPHIGAEINRVSRSSNVVSLADPPGLYIDAVQLAGIVTPDGSPISTWLTWSRGIAGFRTRLTLQAPTKEMSLSDLLVDDEPLEFGGQIAQRMSIRLSASISKTTKTFLPIVCPSPGLPSDTLLAHRVGWTRSGR